ncbi:hypothetical protein CEXT_713691 [Caerostris extrusa]|uniref:Uncharacterized protein n=1 Tax=Caerostris extrusa TaxID=172846 RepID=A0AAV4RGX3_CAEEX|nr:hypothetical protein CEXT_713691 [Caerostris extrusa]
MTESEMHLHSLEAAFFKVRCLEAQKQDRFFDPPIYNPNKEFGSLGNKSKDPLIRMRWNFAGRKYIQGFKVFMIRQTGIRRLFVVLSVNSCSRNFHFLHGHLGESSYCSLAWPERPTFHFPAVRSDLDLSVVQSRCFVKQL